MPEDQELSADARLKQAVKQVARALEAKGVLQESAMTIAKRHAERLFISANGTIRVASQGGNFFPADAANPLDQFVGELYRAVPVTDKASVNTEDREAAQQRLRRTGQY